MSDTKKPVKAKRTYRENGKPLSYDLRVRISGELHERLAARAKARATTPAAIAREILTEALNPDK